MCFASMRVLIISKYGSPNNVFVRLGAMRNGLTYSIFDRVNFMTAVLDIFTGDLTASETKLLLFLFDRYDVTKA